MRLINLEEKVKNFIKRYYFAYKKRVVKEEVLDICSRMQKEMWKLKKQLDKYHFDDINYWSNYHDQMLNDGELNGGQI